MGAASIGGRDWFVLKLNSDGSTVAWTKQFGGLWSEDYARAVAVDVSDNVVVAGQTDGDMNGAGQGLNDIAVVKLNSLGVEQWTYQTGTTGHDVAFAVVTDASENIYLTGFTGGSLHGESLQGNWDVCVIKLSSAGNLEWTKLKGTSGNDRGDGIAIDASGNAIVVVGSTEGTLGASFTGTKDVFAWKLSTSTGTQQWLTQLGSTGEDDANGVQIHASGDVFLVGKTKGGMDGFTNDGPSGSEDFFIVKLDSSGVKQWTFQGGTTTYDYGWGVVVDPLGYSFVLGSTHGAVDGASAGGSDVFLLKLGPSGAQEWVYQTGTSGNDDPVARSLVFDADWNIVLAGSTTSNWPTFTNAGAGDVYVMTVVVPSTTSSSTSSTSTSSSTTTTTTSSSSSTTSSLTSKTVTTTSVTSSTSMSTTSTSTSSSTSSTATSSGTTASTTSSVSSTSSSTSSKSSTTASITISSTLKTLTTSSTSGTVFTGTSETLTTSSTSGTVFTGTSETLTTSSTSGTVFTGTSETLTTSSTSRTAFTGTSETLTTSSTSGTVFTGTSETLTTRSSASSTQTVSSTSTSWTQSISAETVTTSELSEDSTWTSSDATSTWTTSVTSGFATIGDVLEELEDNAADLLSRANEIGPGSAISSASSIGTGTLVKLQSCAS